MPPRQAAQQKLTQQTLVGFLSSSPPPSPSSLFPKSPSTSPSKRKRARKAPSSSSTGHSDKVSDTDSDVGAIRFEPKSTDISDQDRLPRRPKRRKSLAGAHDTPTRTASDESLEETVKVPRRRKGVANVVLDSEDDAGPHKRKLIKGIRPPTPEEDDDILKAGNQVFESRSRSRGKMSAFQKNLEKLKLLKGKKRGEVVPKSPSSSEADQFESSAETPFKGARPHHSGSLDVSQDETDTSSEADDESFIVDDDAHTAAQLPLAFSLSTHQDLTHQFKIVCQLFVHLAVRPLGDRRPFLEHALKEEEYLSVPLQVTRRKLSGMRDSLVGSSTWKSDFKKALEAYPKFTLVRLNFAIPQCDACHLGGRSATLLGRLSGKAYDGYDFEDLSDDESDESSEDDADGAESDVDGEQDIREEFHLGRFCAARTQIYHRFSHWEYSLYKSLQREIVEARDETRRFVKVAYFGGVQPPSDLYDADRIMEWLDERGIIDMEWQKVRQMMDDARNLERGEADAIGV